jgi:hypothetical protein
MYGTDWWPPKLTIDRIAFGIPFVAISSILCWFANVSVFVYFPLLFLSVLIAYIVSKPLLRWFDRMFVWMDERRARYREKN